MNLYHIFNHASSKDCEKNITSSSIQLSFFFIGLKMKALTKRFSKLYFSFKNSILFISKSYHWQTKILNFYPFFENLIRESVNTYYNMFWNHFLLASFILHLTWCYYCMTNEWRLTKQWKLLLSSQLYIVQ